MVVHLLPVHNPPHEQVDAVAAAVAAEWKSMLKNRLKSIIAVILTCALCVAALSGCASSQGSAKQPKPEDIAAAIMKAVAFSDMTAVEKDRLGDFYTLDTSLIEDFSVYICGSGGFTDEIAIFKMKDADGVTAAKKAIDERIAAQKEGFKDYRPEEMPKLENSQVLTNGNYVCFIASSDTDKAAKEFNAAF